ncbi:MAG: hypothetical protein ACE37N_12400 [Pseudohongiellaceae bacterium]
MRLEHYAVDWLRSGDAVRATLGATPYDLMVLDLGLPGVPGMQVLDTVPQPGYPVLLLPARRRRQVDGWTRFRRLPCRSK